MLLTSVGVRIGLSAALRKEIENFLSIGLILMFSWVRGLLGGFIGAVSQRHAVPRALQELLRKRASAEALG